MAYDFSDEEWNEKDEEIDIRGEKYDRLLDLCFRYSTYFSLVYQEKSMPVKGLNENLAVSKITDRWPGTRSYGGHYKICLYRCNPITKNILKSHAHSLFSWVSYWGNNNPEDLAFYRNDKSVFFSQSLMKQWQHFWKDRKKIFKSLSPRGAGKR